MRAVPAIATRTAPSRIISETFFPAADVQLMRRSPRFNALMQDLFAGTQSYLDLKARLLKNLHGTLLESIFNFFLSRLVPRETQT